LHALDRGAEVFMGENSFDQVQAQGDPALLERLSL
jgi:hypothetical protein